MDLGDTGEQLLKPMNDKLKKYVGSRANTPMFGLAMYFKMTGNQYVGPIMAAIQAPSILDGVFGITSHLGPAAMDQLRQHLHTPGQSLIVFSLPIVQPLSFVLFVAEKVDGPRIVLLVNRSANDPSHPFADHPVIQWLRDLRQRTERLRQGEVSSA